MLEHHLHLLEAIQEQLPGLTVNLFQRWATARATELTNRALEDGTQNLTLRTEARLAFELATNPHKQVEVLAWVYDYTYLLYLSISSARRRFPNT